MFGNVKSCSQMWNHSTFDEVASLVETCIAYGRKCKLLCALQLRFTMFYLFADSCSSVAHGKKIESDCVD